MFNLLLPLAFSVICGPVNPLQCSFDVSTKDSTIVSYAWDWGNSRSESHNISTVKNTWKQAGAYLVTLTIIRNDGTTDSTASCINIGSNLVIPINGCSVPYIPITKIVHDTITITKTDTITVNTGSSSVFQDGAAIINDNGDLKVFFNTQFMGKIVLQNDGTVDAIRYVQNLLYTMNMTKQGNYINQIEAVKALINPPPVGFVP